jgi:hypothetical protein
MRREAHATGDINDRLPIIPLESLSVDCCGCLNMKVVNWRLSSAMNAKP